MKIEEIKPLADAIRGEVARVITGQDDMIALMLTALFAGGHILLEGPPGTAKTMTARAFAASLGLDFGRIQFTPDLMPGDIIGSNIYNFQSGEFAMTKGPIFCDLLLADEINRTPAKTQAALLEAMQEHAVTFDGETHRLGRTFMVVATQNPIEHQGVYPLPEAQLDRFLFKHSVDYPTEAQEEMIIKTHGGGAMRDDPAKWEITPQASRETIEAAIDAASSVTLIDEVVTYIASLVRATRMSGDLEVGASPRAGAMLARGARARAALDGRDYVLPDDVKALAVPALRHRVILSATAQIDGREVEPIVAALVEAVEAPR
ncbi:MoxR family ATPase [Sphingorhabdus soli]|uniref:MoxR family ATPase n=1 Tax=Flavisphingopyxis soli TaxID=2601267 RepID=A0A5C6U625_9SPHN|nr:MoxR family ATPase [Sphingorhabdus soli]TXC68307.1 MoxR family ATPase [Sphingorhabdus soli]